MSADMKPTVSMSEAASSATDLEKEGIADPSFGGVRVQRVTELDKAHGDGVQTVRSSELRLGRRKAPALTQNSP